MKSPSFPLIAGLGVVLLSGVLRAAPQLHDLRVVPVAGQPAQMQLTYGPIVPDWIYTPQASTDLKTWAPLTSSTAEDFAGVRTITDLAASGDRRFYRLLGTPPAQLVPPSLAEFRSKPTAANKIYYVDSVHGSDGANGTTPATAWKNLSKIHPLTFQPGDVIRLARGSLWQQQCLYFDDGSVGTAEAPIVIEAYGSGELPTISDPRAPWSLAVRWSGVCFGKDSTAARSAAYFNVLEVRVQDTIETAFSLNHGTHHIVIAGCEARRCGTGVGLAGSQQRVIANYIHDGVMVVDTGSEADDCGAMGVAGCGRDLEVAWNRFVNLTAPSKAFGTDGSVFEFYGNSGGIGWGFVSDDIRIHHNFIENADCFLEASGKVTKLVFAYNVFIRGHNQVFVFHMWDPAPGYKTSYDVRIENNTILHDWAPGTILSFWGGTGAYQPGYHVVFRNNIVSARAAIGHSLSSLGADLVHDHNLIRLLPGGALEDYDPNNKWVLGATEQLGDPKFLDALGEDFRLAPGSPAIDAGVPIIDPDHPSHFTTDLRGTPVPTGNAPDLGAYEAR